MTEILKDLNRKDLLDSLNTVNEAMIAKLQLAHALRDSADIERSIERQHMQARINVLEEQNTTQAALSDHWKGRFNKERLQKWILVGGALFLLILSSQA
jgi:hypothetical protein